MECCGCEKARLKMAINHQSRCNPFYNCAKQPVNNGYVGELRIIRTMGVDTGFDMPNNGPHLFDAVRIFEGDEEWI